MKLYTLGPDHTMCGQAFTSYLLGKLPPCTLVAQGMSLYFTEVVPDSLPKSIVEMTEGPLHSVRSDEPEGKTRLAWREYLAHHHLPPRVQVLAMPDGAAVVPAGTVDVSEAQEIVFSNPLLDVLTAKEVADTYALPVKKVEADILNPDSPFAKGETRKSGREWLIIRQAASRVYAGKTEAVPARNPLLCSFTTVEAAELWNRSSGEVRSAAAGAGHRAARMDDNDRRQAGRTWLVNYAAMERLYGTPNAEEWNKMIGLMSHYSSNKS